MSGFPGADQPAGGAGAGAAAAPGDTPGIFYVVKTVNLVNAAALAVCGTLKSQVHSRPRWERLLTHAKRLCWCESSAMCTLYLLLVRDGSRALVRASIRHQTRRHSCPTHLSPPDRCAGVPSVQGRRVRRPPHHHRLLHHQLRSYPALHGKHRCLLALRAYVWRGCMHKSRSALCTSSHLFLPNTKTNVHETTKTFSGMPLPIHGVLHFRQVWFPLHLARAHLLLLALRHALLRVPARLWLRHRFLHAGQHALQLHRHVLLAPLQRACE